MYPGDIFADRYEIRGTLGEGGTATVYRAFDARIEREVALKIIDLGAEPEKTRARFQREVQILGSLRGAHTVQLYAHGFGNGSLWLVTELVPGRDLEEVLHARGAFTEREVVHVLRQILRALHEAHEKGLVHRDIKPDNIRVFEYMGDPFYAKLLDFGIARSTATDRSVITREGGWVGTPQFMSPEQIMGEELDARSDLYSLGVVAFEMLTGRPAIDGADAAAAFAQQMNRSLALPPDLPISAELRAIIHRMVDKDPARRFGSAAEILKLLGDPSSGTVSSPVAHPVPSPGPPREPESRGELAGPLSSLLAAGAVILLVGGGIALLLPSGEREPEPEPPPAPLEEAVRERPVPPREHALAASPHDIGFTGERDLSSARLDAGKRRTRGRDAGNDSSFLDASVSPCDGQPGERKINGRTPVGKGSAKWTLDFPPGYDAKTPVPLALMVTEIDRSGNGEADASGMDRLGQERGWGTVKITRASRIDRAMVLKDPPSLWEESVLAAAVLSEIVAKHCVDPDRLHVIGVSQGAAVAELIPCHFDLAGLALVSWRASRMPSRCGDRNAVPTIALVGDEDPALPRAGTTNACGMGPVVSAAVHESLLHEVAECSVSDRGAESVSEHATCRRFDSCSAPLTLCEFDGGFGWGSRNSLTAQLLQCERGSTSYPVMERIFEFFEANHQSSAGNDR